MNKGNLIYFVANFPNKILCPYITSFKNKYLFASFIFKIVFKSCSTPKYPQFLNEIKKQNEIKKF